MELRESVYIYPASRAGPEASESLEWLTTIILGLLELGCGLWSLLSSVTGTLAQPAAFGYNSNSLASSSAIPTKPFLFSKITIETQEPTS